MPGFLVLLLHSFVFYSDIFLCLSNRAGLGIIMGRGFCDNSGTNWPFTLNMALLCVVVTLNC